MENPEEILHSLEEFAKLKPKDIPRELEEYLCFVAKTGDPVYQWSLIKSLFREKLISVITEFYESCPSVDIPPCPNVDLFNYDTMKNFILEKLDTFIAAPFTVQRICELLTTPRKEYNRIDKYMRALEKNILVVSTTEPGNHRTPENGEGFVNGVETEHIQDGTNDINIEEMDDTPVWSTTSAAEATSFQSTSKNDMVVDTATESTNNGSNETVITCCPVEEQPYVSIEPVTTETKRVEGAADSDVSVTITAIPAAVQKRRDSIEPPSEQSEEAVTSTSSVEEIKEVESAVKEKLTEEAVNVETSDSVAEKEPEKPEVAPVIEPVLEITEAVKEVEIETPVIEILKIEEMAEIVKKVIKQVENEPVEVEPAEFAEIESTVVTPPEIVKEDVPKIEETVESLSVVEAVISENVKEQPAEVPEITKPQSPDKVEPPKEEVPIEPIIAVEETKTEEVPMTEAKETEELPTEMTTEIAPPPIDVAETPMEVDLPSNETAETTAEVVAENQ